MQFLVENAFPSQLSSFKFIGNWKDGWLYHFNGEDRFKFLRSLNTTHSSIIIQKYIFKRHKWFADSIKFFSKADTVEFNYWQYWNWKDDDKDIELEGVQIKNIVFAFCWIASTKIIKKVLIESGLAQTLDKVTFYGIRKGKEEVELMIEEYLSTV